MKMSSLMPLSISALRLRATITAIVTVALLSSLAYQALATKGVHEDAVASQSKHLVIPVAPVAVASSAAQASVNTTTSSDTTSKGAKSTASVTTSRQTSVSRQPVGSTYGLGFQPQTAGYQIQGVYRVDFAIYASTSLFPQPFAASASIVEEPNAGAGAYCYATLDSALGGHITITVPDYSAANGHYACRLTTINNGVSKSLDFDVTATYGEITH